MSVTFLDNHDTDTPSSAPDPFGSDDEVLQGYAYLMAHRGLPCVFWGHYFDAPPVVAEKIRALIDVRKTKRGRAGLDRQHRRR